MPKTLDITGQRFGRLVAESLFSRIRKSNKCVCSKWLCRCDCGASTVVYLGHLRNGHTQSCGCLCKPTKVSVLRVVFSVYKTAARKRGLEFTLSAERTLELLDSPCYYCGADASNEIAHQSNKHLRVKYTGIDRVDNSLGYVEGNVVSCCFLCNRAKNKFTAKEFIDMCLRVSQRHISFS